MRKEKVLMTIKKIVNTTLNILLILVKGQEEACKQRQAILEKEEYVWCYARGKLAPRGLAMNADKK